MSKIFWRQWNMTKVLKHKMGVKKCEKLTNLSETNGIHKRQTDTGDTSWISNRIKRKRLGNW